MATLFGDNGAHVTGASGWLSNYIYGGKFTLAEACSATSLAARLYDNGAAQVFRLVLYAADGTAGVAKTLKGVTAEMTVADGDTDKLMRQGDITPVALAAADYYIGIWWGAGNGIGWSKGANTGGPTTGYKSLAYHATNSPGDIASGWTGGELGTIRIICNYTATAAGCPRQSMYLACMRNE